MVGTPAVPSVIALQSTVGHLMGHWYPETRTDFQNASMTRER
jgi:hypothetical protein